MADSDYTIRGGGAFCAIATLSEDIGPGDTTWTVSNFKSTLAAPVVVGTELMIGDEILKVTAVPSGGSMSASRGCGDSIPLSHLDGEPIFFLTAIGDDDREYAAGQVLGVKILPKTSAGSQVPISGSPPQELEMNSRFARPYPPGAMLAQGTAWHLGVKAVSLTTGLDLAWANRNRVSQADTLLSHADGNVTPEAGQTQRARVYDSTDTLVATYSGLTGTSWNYPYASMATDMGTETVGYIIFTTVRDGYDSRHSYRIDFEMPTPILGSIGILALAGLPAEINGNFIACNIGNLALTGLVMTLGDNPVPSANVSLLLHCNGTNGSSSFPDSGPIGHTVTATGAVLTTTAPVIGSAAYSGTGGSDHLTVPAHASFDLGSGDFFITGRARSTNAGLQVICTSRGALDRGVFIYTSGGVLNCAVWNGSGTAIGVVTMTGVPNDNTMFDWAYGRSGDDFTAYVNGNAGTPVTQSGTAGGGNDFLVGYDPQVGGRQYQGVIDELLYLKGLCLHTASYTPPVGEYTPV